MDFLILIKLRTYFKRGGMLYIVNTGFFFKQSNYKESL